MMYHAKVGDIVRCGDSEFRVLATSTFGHHITELEALRTKDILKSAGWNVRIFSLISRPFDTEGDEDELYI